MATNTARRLADIVVTEAGFGADLGAEKFMHIKSRKGNFHPDAVVIVATVRALKMHGGVEKNQLTQPNTDAVKRGMANLAKHVDTIRQFGIEPVVALNRFTADAQDELQEVMDWANAQGVQIALTNVWEQGGKGGLELAKLVKKELAKPKNFTMLYEETDSVEEKLRIIVQQVYGGAGIQLSDSAKKKLVELKKYGWDALPICMAKTQYSLSDQPSLHGRPEGFTITIRDIIPKLGAGFLVCLTGDIMTMPGLPKQPAALNMDVDPDGNAVGLF
jgi:formate--tetrahydrofolate ligase